MRKKSHIQFNRKKLVFVRLCRTSQKNRVKIGIRMSFDRWKVRRPANFCPFIISVEWKRLEDKVRLKFARYLCTYCIMPAGDICKTCCMKRERGTLQCHFRKIHVSICSYEFYLPERILLAKITLANSCVFAQFI